jgi:tetratricopeptide (TPR) repeat protein
MRTRSSLIFVSISLLALGGACAMKLKDVPTAIQTENISTGPADSTDGEINAALKSIEKTPDITTGYTKLAALYIKRARQNGDFSLNSKAETAVSRALELDAQDIAARKLQASLNLTFHRFDKGLELGAALQKDLPSDPFVYGILTDANAELGNYDDAVKSAQKMVDLRPNSSSYARVAHMRSLYGDSRGAIEMYQLAARTADPQDMEAQSWCYVQLSKEYSKIGNLAAAEKAVDEALKFLPDYYLATTQKGVVLAAKGDLEGAARILTDSQNRVPQVETVITLGDIFAKTGDTEKAKQQYALAETIEQNFGNTDMRRLAQLWADRDIRPADALSIATGENAKRRDIYTADVYAWCLYKNGKYAEAKTVITQAMRLKTNDARIFFHAGMIEKDLGNKKEAVRDLELALKMNPTFDLLQTEDAKKALAELK